MSDRFFCLFKPFSQFIFSQPLALDQCVWFRLLPHNQIYCKKKKSRTRTSERTMQGKTLIIAIDEGNWRVQGPQGLRFQVTSPLASSHWLDSLAGSTLIQFAGRNFRNIFAYDSLTDLIHASHYSHQIVRAKHMRTSCACQIQLQFGMVNLTAYRIVLELSFTEPMPAAYCGNTTNATVCTHRQSSYICSEWPDF